MVKHLFDSAFRIFPTTEAVSNAYCEWIIDLGHVADRWSESQEKEPKSGVQNQLCHRPSRLFAASSQQFEPAYSTPDPEVWYM